MPNPKRQSATPEILVYVSRKQTALPLLSREHPEVPPITIMADRVSGAPTLAGTRLRVAALLDYLAAGGTVKQFVKEYDEVTQADCEAALAYLRDEVEARGIGVRVSK